VTRAVGRAAGPVALALALVIMLVVGCGKREGHVDEGGAFDVETMAYLSEARALHHQAGIKEDSGDLAGAVAALGRLTAATRPHPERTTPEVEEVLADALARRAELELRMGNTDAALASVHEGLRHAEAPTFFRGHLLEVEGLVEKARGGALADAGREEEARAARARAIELLDQAVKVQEGVIVAALRDAGGDR
jgi:tetratricopeptide (TPR) repeat protein